MLEGGYCGGGAYGIISSFNPLRNRMGMSVIWGRTSSLGQSWVQRRARYFAGGMALEHVSDLPVQTVGSVVGR